MSPPVFELAAASTSVKAAIGNPPRLYPFGEAPQDVQRPYAVWQTVFGSPENYLGDTPDMDSYGVQVDVYGKTVDSCRGVARALRDAFEGSAHITAWNGEGREPETRDFRYGFTVEFVQNR